MTARRIAALVAAVTVVLAGCGGGGGKTASSSDTGSTKTDQSSSSSKAPSAQAKNAADDFSAARTKANDAGGAPFQDQQTAFKNQDLAGLKSTQAKLRDVDFQFDKEVRAIAFPDDVAVQRNAYLSDNGDVIAAEDASQNATSVAEFDKTNLTAGRLATKRRDDGFDLLRELGFPDPEDNGHPDAPAPSGKIVLKDDFSDPTSGWFVSNSPEGAYSYSGGKYVLESAGLGTAMASDSNLSDGKADPKLASLDQVSVEVDVTATQAVGGNVGVHCHAAEKRAYVGLIEPTTGLWTIGEIGDGQFSSLAQDSSMIIKDVGEVNHVRLDCVHSGSGIKIVLFVNGKEMGETIDSAGALSPGAIALSAETFLGGCCTVAQYDNLVIRDVS